MPDNKESVLVPGLVLVALAALAPLAHAQEAERLTRVTEGGEVAEQGFEALVDEGARTDRGAAPTARALADFQAANLDFWIYDASVRLRYDDDGDGYFHALVVELDADTVYLAADVYARLFLSYEGGPWNELATTRVFTILGSSPSDDYVVEAELIAGYPPGHYDLLIELYDAVTDRFVADFGPAASGELFAIPLEDADHDVPAYPYYSETYVSEGGGGAMGWLTLGLGLIAGMRAAAGGRSRRGRPPLRRSAAGTGSAGTWPRPRRWAG